jgi:hypothetical protein
MSFLFNLFGDCIEHTTRSKSISISNFNSNHDERCLLGRKGELVCVLHNDNEYCSLVYPYFFLYASSVTHLLRTTPTTISSDLLRTQQT